MRKQKARNPPGLSLFFVEGRRAELERIRIACIGVEVGRGFIAIPHRVRFSFSLGFDGGNRKEEKS